MQNPASDDTSTASEKSQGEADLHSQQRMLMTDGECIKDFDKIMLNNGGFENQKMSFVQAINLQIPKNSKSGRASTIFC